IKTILTRSDKNNVILVGDPGVGRTSLVYGFARKVCYGTVPPALAHRRVIQLDVGRLLAGVQNEGELQERLLGVLDDAVAAGNIILFIDDI
ncbi:MAG: AAA family ATPase, partial [Candidatus Aenigmarchaeota archaeon]|nr:AAA family ATPase [Candidatus Aenigmarchaeota archaeon]